MKAFIFALLFVCLAFAHDTQIISQEMIDRINNDKSASWKAGVNAIFKGKTLSQVRHLFGAVLIDPRTDNRPRLFHEVANDFLPAAFDARTQWKSCIHPIRDQGHCGSCWAFSASEVHSDRTCIASQGKINVVLSPQDMVSCDTADYGCQGGYLDKAWSYIMNNGIVSDACLPYKSYDGKTFACPFSQTKKECTEAGQEYKKYYAVRESVQFLGNVESAMLEISTNGPIQTGFRVYQDFFSYKSGVYHHVSGSFAGGHAVKVVGWGHDSTSNKDYWIVANSWGESWGINGFFWIQKGSDECAVESQMITGHADMTRADL